MAEAPPFGREGSERRSDKEEYKTGEGLGKLMQYVHAGLVKYLGLVADSVDAVLQH